MVFGLAHLVAAELAIFVGDPASLGDGFHAVSAHRWSLLDLHKGPTWTLQVGVSDDDLHILVGRVVAHPIRGIGKKN
jgi:hypothetical protein